MSVQMFRRPATLTLQLNKNSLVIARDFTSTTCLNAEENKKPRGETSPRNTPNTPAANGPSNRRETAVRRVMDVFDRSSTTQNDPAVRKPAFTIRRQLVDGPLRQGNGPSSARAQPDGRQALSPNNDQLKQRLRERAGNRTIGSGGRDRRANGPFARTKLKPRGQRAESSPIKYAKEELPEDVVAYYEEKRAKMVRKPVRYNPEPYTVEKLKETWPAFAVDGYSSTSIVREKLSWFGDVHVGAHEFPQDLAKRLQAGKRVLFANDAQRAETMEYAKKYAKKRAESISQSKGEEIEPKAIEFENIDEKEKSNMITSLIRGAYEDPSKVDPGISPILSNVLKNLNNNNTYHTQHTQRFMASLQKNLPLKKKAPAATA